MSEVGTDYSQIIKDYDEFKKNIKQLEQQLKEAESVINELIDKTDYGVNQWQQAFAPNEETEAQRVIRKARQYLAKYKTNE